MSDGFDVYDPGGGYDLYDTSPGASAAARPWTRYLGGLGEALITLGLIIALYAVYELWWSNITAGQQIRRNSAALLRTWADTPPPAAAKPSDAIAIGQSFGFLYIPAFGADWRALIMQSVDRTRVLNTGAVGHYTQPPSALPWDASGNFAIAGHRDGHGMVFRDLDQLAAGDRVYVQTEYGWFVYQLDREASSVPINDVGAVEPIPVGSGFTKPGRYITLTTCTPMYIDSSRMVWWGHLIQQTPKGRVPAGVTPIP
ncbi:MAG TPA: class E sortase [Actinocrinis sp.]|nr:class E sortase [Actinocrinis sp.]